MDQSEREKRKHHRMSRSRPEVSRFVKENLSKHAKGEQRITGSKKILENEQFAVHSTEELHSITFGLEITPWSNARLFCGYFFPTACLF